MSKITKLLDPSTSVSSSSIPTSEEIVRRIREIQPVLRKNGAQNEADRRIAEESIQALVDAGVFRATVPKRYAGYEMNMRDMLNLSSAVGEADGSTAWVVALILVDIWTTCLYSIKTQDEVFKNDPDARVAGALGQSTDVRKVEGGYRVSGRWYYNSGCMHSNWNMIGLAHLGEPDGAPNWVFALVPMSDGRIEETWFVAGMKGTGSNCFVGEDIFIPEHRIISARDLIKGAHANENLVDEPSYRSALFPVHAGVLIGPQLGLARGALVYVKEMGFKKTVFPMPGSPLHADTVTFQMQIAQAATLIDTAEMHAYRAADDIDNAAALGVFPDVLSRSRMYADFACAVESITKAFEILMFAHGAGGFAEVNPLQRMWRDASVAARHVANMPALRQEIYGKALLGKTPPIPWI